MMYKYAVFLTCAVVAAVIDANVAQDVAPAAAPAFVGFSATMNETKNFTDGQTVKYNNVITNAGNNYDPNTGVFTAPMTAYYACHIHALSLTGFWFQLIHNEVPRVSAQGTTPNAWAMGGNSVLLYVKAGERVYVRAVLYKSSAFGDSKQNYATFTCYLSGL
ncbi:hypothetical protein BsWGS_25979 [Bradybaena similaris]